MQMCIHKNLITVHHKHTVEFVPDNNKNVFDLELRSLSSTSFKQNFESSLDASSTNESLWQYGHLISSTLLPQQLHSITPSGEAPIIGHCGFMTSPLTKTLNHCASWN